MFILILSSLPTPVIILQAKEEKRLQADRMREWARPRDDLLCDDLQPFPTSAPVPSVLSPIFGDIIMVIEFLNTFGEHLGVEDRFPSGINIGWLLDIYLCGLLIGMSSLCRSSYGFKFQKKINGGQRKVM